MGLFFCDYCLQEIPHPNTLECESGERLCVHLESAGAVAVWLRCELDDGRKLAKLYSRGGLLCRSCAVRFRVAGRRPYAPPTLAPLTPGDPRAKRLAEAILRGHATAQRMIGALTDKERAILEKRLPGSGGDEPPVSAPSAPSDTEPAPAPEPDPLPSEATAPLPPLAGSEATPAPSPFDAVCAQCGTRDHIDGVSSWVAWSNGHEGHAGRALYF